MPETITVPSTVVEAATDSALQVHAALDDIAHTEIAQTEDEDYAWLTERLDALRSEVTQLRSQSATQYESIAFTFRESMSQSQELIRNQTILIQTLSEGIAALTVANASASLTLTQTALETSSETEPLPGTIAVTEVEPVVAAVTGESSVPGPANAGKKRLRM